NTQHPTPNASPSPTPNQQPTVNNQQPTVHNSQSTIHNPQFPAPSPSPSAYPLHPLPYLAAALEQELAAFPGLSSYVVIDLQTGEQLAHNADLAIAGMSLLKIPILINTYRVLDRPPNVEETKLITQTTALSSNFAANLLLQTIAGQPSSTAGADVVTASMRELGLYNTFIVVPYDAEPLPGRPLTLLTPANQRTDLTTQPDIHRQTTTGDLAQMLWMLYDCAENGRGPLPETYPDDLTQAECAAILDALRLNELVKLLEAGLPADTPISHKLGYIDDTYGDAAIVYSPAGDYVLVLALYAPVWLEWAVASPLFARISRLVYDHFNDPAAYPPEVLAAPPALAASPTPPPTPDLPQAIVTGTAGVGLTLRDAPGGAELAILPEGTVVGLLPDAPIDFNGLTWRKIRSPAGPEGWVGAAYLTTR
ncbi:MAG: serine hydrolase, partial [Anaerolineales bacterium]|nr:serine hydrolase [Anaerolineales bacterium]